MPLSCGTLTLQKDIDRLERTQRKAARFITGDYRSREPGSMTRMLADLRLDPLITRRKHSRLTLFYKIVNDLVPALPPAEFLTPARPKRKIKPKNFKDYVYKNVVEDLAILNTKGYDVPSVSTPEYKNSFFQRTTTDWNHLDEDLVCATSVVTFKSALLA